MTTYKPRLIDELIERKLRAVGGIVLKGPRFVGKTTTALAHSKSSIRLDSSPDMAQQATLTPNILLAGDVPRVIDEWQLAPSIWNAVRYELDQRSKPGQFILTGSVAPDEDLTRHTGTGRISRIALKPMTLQESDDSTNQVNVSALFSDNPNIEGFGGPNFEDYAGLIVRGGWPALIQMSSEDAQVALIDYIDNVSLVDLRTLSSPPDPERMKALIAAVARNLSTEATLDNLAKEAQLHGADLAAQTVRKYLDQLSQIFILDEVSAWKPHLRSSIQMRVKPKWHFVDPSLATAALRISADDLLADLKTMGLFFESMVMRDLSVYAQSVDAQLFHYRDSSDLEVDAILQNARGQWAAIEVKLGGQVAIEEAAESLLKLRKRVTKEKLAQLKVSAIITAGQHSYIRPDGIAVIALGHLHYE